MACKIELGVTDAETESLTGRSSSGDDRQIVHGKDDYPYEQAASAERARLIATSAEKFAREKFGLKGGGKLPRDFDPDTEPRSLAQVNSLGSVAAVSFDGPAAGVQGGVASGASGAGGSTGGRPRMASPDSPADNPYGFDGPEGAYESFGGPPNNTEASHSMPEIAPSMYCNLMATYRN
jgi:hypothetical protein